MENMERDRFLTETMNTCYPLLFFGKCNTKYSECYSLDFNTWDGFGKLWKWCLNQHWFPVFVSQKTGESWNRFGNNKITSDLINPEYFANSVYNFLLTRKNLND